MLGGESAESGQERRVARTTVIVVLAGFAAVYVLAAPSRVAHPWLAPLAMGLIALVTVLQVTLVVPKLSRLRGTGWTAVQVAAAYAAVGCGVSVGLLGLPAARLLHRRRPVAAGLVLLGAAGIAVASSAAESTILAVLMALVGYGLTRLADLVEEVAAARLTLAMSAVAEERLRIAADLGTGLSDGLAAIGRIGPNAESIDEALRTARTALAAARQAAVQFRDLSLAPEATAARALLDAAGIAAEVHVGHTEPLGSAGALLATLLREAVTDVVRQGTARRCVITTSERDGRIRLIVSNDGVRTADLGAAGLAGVITRVEAAGGHASTGLASDGAFTVEADVVATPRPVAPPDRTAARLSVVLLAVVVAGFSAQTLLQLPVRTALAAAGPLVALGILQLRWTRTASGRWWALPAQAVLSYLPVVWFGPTWSGMAGALAGSLLVTLPLTVAAPLVAAAALTTAGICAALGKSIPVVVNYGISVPVTGLVIYGLVRLARQVEELRAAGAELARAAVVEERLRAARDLHDLLGHSLAAILLKCELARRLLPADPPRARAELDDVVRMTAQAREDVRAVTGSGEPAVPFPVELASARSVLSAAGIATDAAALPPLPEPAGTTLSAVLREAVTNILRHSTARHCRITVTIEPPPLPGSPPSGSPALGLPVPSGPGRRGSQAGGVTAGRVVRLMVENDGVDAAAPVRARGAGIGNLTTRVAGLGGWLSARAEGGWFRVVAELPLDPAGLGGDADGVGAVAGVQLGDDRREVIADGSGG